MIIQDQDRTCIYNSDNLECIGISQVGDRWVIVFAREATDKQYGMAVYSTKERAQFELDRLMEAFARDAKVYVMPEE